MRITKEKEVRQSEILDVAEQLFNTKGYADTSISDILQQTGIARGTLYYHFKSKEEILDAVIDRRLERRAAEMKKVADSNLTVFDKYYKIIEIQMSQGTVVEGLHNIENAQFHQKSFSLGLKRFAPIYCQVEEEGIKQNLFHIEQPYETAELLLCASRITDPGIFVWTKEQLAEKNESYITLLERALGAEQGYFSALLPLLNKINGGTL
ncbi:MAG: TetR/AcrR family transcriptional regulator [Clostridia bacterium]|nr:TetR/AcrR family transcriptional regulator [Clostridia bacterium]